MRMVSKASLKNNRAGMRALYHQTQTSNKNHTQIRKIQFHAWIKQH